MSLLLPLRDTMSKWCLFTLPMPLPIFYEFIIYPLNCLFSRLKFPSLCSFSSPGSHSYLWSSLLAFSLPTTALPYSFLRWENQGCLLIMQGQSNTLIITSIISQTIFVLTFNKTFISLDSLLQARIWNSRLANEYCFWHSKFKFVFKW